MNRSGVEILWDNEEADINGFMLEACGIASTDFLLNERLLTRENFEKNYKVLVKMAESRGRRAPYFVLGYFALLTGARISEKLRQKILEIAKWEHEEGYWQDTGFALKRKIYLEDFSEKIRIHKAGTKLHPAFFKYRDEDFTKSKIIVGLSQLDDVFENRKISDIKHVNLDGWGLESIPEEIYEFKFLRSLSLEFNQIPNISSDISNLTLLKHLYLGYNHFRSLPESIGMLSSLRSLGIKHNDISKLPRSLENLKNLRHIYVRGTKIKGVPNFLKGSSFDNLNSTIYL